MLFTNFINLVLFLLSSSLSSFVVVVVIIVKCPLPLPLPLGVAPLNGTTSNASSCAHVAPPPHRHSFLKVDCCFDWLRWHLSSSLSAAMAASSLVARCSCPPDNDNHTNPSPGTQAPLAFGRMLGEGVHTQGGLPTRLDGGHQKLTAR